MTDVQYNLTIDKWDQVSPGRYEAETYKARQQFQIELETVAEDEVNNWVVRRIHSDGSAVTYTSPSLKEAKRICEDWLEPQDIDPSSNE